MALNLLKTEQPLSGCKILNIERNEIQNLVRSAFLSREESDRSMSVSSIVEFILKNRPKIACSRDAIYTPLDYHIFRKELFMNVVDNLNDNPESVLLIKNENTFSSVYTFVESGKEASLSPFSKNIEKDDEGRGDNNSRKRVNVISEQNEVVKRRKETNLHEALPIADEKQNNISGNPAPIWTSLKDVPPKKRFTVKQSDIGLVSVSTISLKENSLSSNSSTSPADLSVVDINQLQEKETCNRKEQNHVTSQNVSDTFNTSNNFSDDHIIKEVNLSDLPKFEESAINQLTTDQLSQLLAEVERHGINLMDQEFTECISNYEMQRATNTNQSESQLVFKPLDTRSRVTRPKPKSDLPSFDHLPVLSPQKIEELTKKSKEHRQKWQIRYEQQLSMQQQLPKQMPVQLTPNSIANGNLVKPVNREFYLPANNGPTTTQSKGNLLVQPIRSYSCMPSWQLPFRKRSYQQTVSSSTADNKVLLLSELDPMISGLSPDCKRSRKF